MNTYTVTRWLSMPVITVSANYYAFEAGFVNFYATLAGATTPTKVDSFYAATVTRIQKN